MPSLSTILAVLALILCPVMLVTGCKLQQGIDAKNAIKQMAKSTKVDSKQDVVGQTVAVEQQKAQDHIVYVHDKIAERINEIIPPAVDVELPVGFVRVHDAAAAGLPLAAETPSLAWDSPSGVKASDAAPVVNDNYEECLADASRVRGWQSWWAGVGAANGVKPKDLYEPSTPQP